VAKKPTPKKASPEQVDEAGAAEPSSEQGDQATPAEPSAQQGDQATPAEPSAEEVVAAAAPEPTPEEVDQAILDYLCDSRQDADEVLAATGLAGLRRVIDISTPEGLSTLPSRPDMPSGTDALDAWNAAMWTMVRSVQQLAAEKDLVVPDAEIRWISTWEPRAGINLLRGLAENHPERARRLCQWLVTLVYLFQAGGFERKMEPADRAEAEKLLRQLSEVSSSS
jgi:hypothetical protein